MGGGTNAACTWESWQNPCGPGWYCHAPDCVTGTCEPRPPAFDTTAGAAPVCGCNGITYWNAEFAAVKGMTVASAGPCADGPSCSPGGAECPPSYDCSAVVDSFASCSAGLTEWSCWAVPNTCPPDVADHKLCSGNVDCHDLCSAVKSGVAFYPAGNDCS